MDAEELTVLRAQYTSEYEEFTAAVEAYIPDREDLQLPPLERLVDMSEGDVERLVSAMERTRYMGQVIARFQFFADVLRLLPTRTRNTADKPLQNAA